MKRYTWFIGMTIAITGLAGWQPAAIGNSPTDNGCWKIVPSPNVDGHSNGLYRISVISANDIWASGDYGDGTEASVHPISEHWDGTQWTLVPVPTMGTGGTRLQGIAAVGPNDVWMVGAFDLSTSYEPVTEHWDGSQWNVVSTPALPLEGTPLLRGTIGLLRGVAALASNDVWAVGYTDFETRIQTLIEHWDGAQWTVVSSPNAVPSKTSILHEVKGLSPNDVWAVGWSDLGGTLAEHWDGTQWSIVSTPNIGAGTANNPSGNSLDGVSPVSANDVWAVGAAPTGAALTMHWDGTQWTLVPNPVSSGILYAVKAIATNDVWAVGSDSANKALAIHWDGTAWSLVPAVDDPSQSFSYLFGIDAVSGTEIWAVTGASKTLVERFTSPCLAPISVVSRKTHGTAGTFDIDLPLAGGPGIECRSGGANGDYTIVFTFANSLTTVGSADVTSGTGSVTDSAIDSTDAHRYVVNLTGVTNAQTIIVSLTNASDSAGGFSASGISIPVGVLVADVNATRRVDAADVSLVRQQTLQPITSSNFRDDINGSGRIDASDVSIARQQTLTSLP